MPACSLPSSTGPWSRCTSCSTSRSGSTTSRGRERAWTSSSSPAATFRGGWRAPRWSPPPSRPIRRWRSRAWWRKGGIAGNWLWWNLVASGMLTVFFYARLWRRSGVMTDIEFAEIRYAGKPAAFLRGFRALYLAIPDQLHHPGLGEHGDGRYPDADPGRHETAGADDRAGHDRAHVVDLDALGAVGRAGHRPVSVRRSRWAW